MIPMELRQRQRGQCCFKTSLHFVTKTHVVPRHAQLPWRFTIEESRPFIVAKIALPIRAIRNLTDVAILPFHTPPRFIDVVKQE